MSKCIWMKKTKRVQEWTNVKKNDKQYNIKTICLNNKLINNKTVMSYTITYECITSTSTSTSEIHFIIILRWIHYFCFVVCSWFSSFFFSCAYGIFRLFASFTPSHKTDGDSLISQSPVKETVIMENDRQRGRHHKIAREIKLKKTNSIKYKHNDTETTKTWKHWSKCITWRIISCVRIQFTRCTRLLC